MDKIAEFFDMPPMDEKDLDEVNNYREWHHENNSGTRIRHSPKFKEHLSKVAKERFKNKENHPMKGKMHSDATKEKIRQSRLGKSSARKGVDPWNKGVATSEETKRKISEAKTGVTHSADAKAAISKAAKNRVKKTCPHCGKSVDASNYARWHGDNCKNG